jgi:hypothetical protein
MSSKANVYPEWVAPCLFRSKKNGVVRILTDLRQLNKCLIRKLVHVPLIDEILRKIQGFTVATFLDLNTDYHHFELYRDSQKLCGIVLSWDDTSIHDCHKDICPLLTSFKAT